MFSDIVNYKQCELERKRPHGNNFFVVSTVVWIPEEFAVIDNFISLKDRNGDWSKNWQVKRVSEATKPLPNEDLYNMMDIQHG